MRRREFIMLIGGAAVWSSAAHAQQVERIRRVGILMALSENDPQGKEVSPPSGTCRPWMDRGE